MSQVQAAVLTGGETQKLIFTPWQIFSSKKNNHQRCLFSPRYPKCLQLFSDCLWPNGEVTTADDKMNMLLAKTRKREKFCKGEQSESRVRAEVTADADFDVREQKPGPLLRSKPLLNKRWLARRCSGEVKNWYACPSAADTHLQRNWIVIRSGENSQRDKVADVVCFATSSAMGQTLE